VCAIERLIKTDEKVDTIIKATPLAGELAIHGGGPFDYQVSRLSETDPDSGNEGLRILMKGGFEEEKGVKRKQQTVIDFVCNKDLDGTEAEYDPEDKYEHIDDTLQARASPLLYRSVGARAEDDKDDKDDSTPSQEVQLGIEKGPSLVFNRYGPSDSDTNVDVLHLTWSSKYVCQSKADDGSDGGGGDEDDGTKKPSSHWGVFTWIVIL
jgi:hypothetical protein